MNDIIDYVDGPQHEMLDRGQSSFETPYAQEQKTDSPSTVKTLGIPLIVKLALGAAGLYLLTK